MSILYQIAPLLQPMGAIWAMSRVIALREARDTKKQSWLYLLISACLVFSWGGSLTALPTNELSTTIYVYCWLGIILFGLVTIFFYVSSIRLLKENEYVAGAGMLALTVFLTGLFVLFTMSMTEYFIVNSGRWECTATHQELRDGKITNVCDTYKRIS